MLTIVQLYLLASTWLIMISSAPLSDKNSTLRGVQIIFRHGRRSPLKFFVNDPNNAFWNVTNGQLTEEGKQDGYDLGVWFRQNYEEFMSTFVKDEMISIESTNITRTIMSAKLFLAGLHSLKPEEVWSNDILTKLQRIRIYSNFGDSSSCPRYGQLAGMLSQTPEAVRFRAENKVIIKKLLRALGKSENSLSYFSAFDIIMCTEAHHKKLPDWIQDDMSKINALFQYSINFSAKMPELAKFSGGELLVKIMNRFVDIKNNKSLDIDKVYAYSGHDTNVLPLLNAFGVFNFRWPPFSAALILELHEKNENDYLRVLYRNDSSRPPYVLNIPSCEEYCPWENAWNSTRNYFLNNKDEECKAWPSDEYAQKKIEIDRKFP